MERYRTAWASGTIGADQKEMAALEKMHMLQYEQTKIAGNIDKIDKKLQPSYVALEGMQKEAGILEQRLASAADKPGLMVPALQQSENYMERFVKHLKTLAKRVFVFYVISAALRALRTWMNRVIKSNSEASAAMAKLRGALLTLAQPIVEVIIPAFTLLVNILTRVVSVAAQVLSAMFGKSISQSKEAAQALHNQTKALEKTGAVAKKTSKSLASIDELDTLSSSKDDAGADGLSIEPSFDFDTADAEGNLDKILNLVKLIGTAFLSWRLSKALGGGVKKAIGLFMAFDGAIGFASSTWDAWNNGINKSNLLGMLGRTAELEAGLYIALGPTAAAVGLLVTGVTMIATAFHDAFENGWNFQNTLLTIAGILATGLGIAILTGSWIPLFIAGIAAILLALTTAFGGGEKLLEGARTILDGFLDFFRGIFAGDIEQTVMGIQKIFEGLGLVFAAAIESVKNMFLNFLTWLDEKTNGKFHGIIEFMKSLVSGACDLFTSVVGVAIDTIRDIFIRLTKFLMGVFTSDWDLAWQGVQDIFKGVWNGIVGLMEAACNLVIEGINLLIKGFNGLSFTVPDWIPGIGGESWGPSLSLIDRLEIPRLAAGAVIPPNREFMAVLGDQKRGTNIEAPLDTIKQAVAEVLVAKGTGGQQSSEEKAVIVLDGRVLGEFIIRYINDKTQLENMSPILI